MTRRFDPGNLRRVMVSMPVAWGLLVSGCSCDSDSSPSAPDASSTAGNAGGSGGEDSDGGQAGVGGAGADAGDSTGGTSSGAAGDDGDPLACAGCAEFPCDSPGETGVRSCTLAGTCFCETEINYFVALEGNSATRCDADGDGFVNDSAQAAIEGADGNLRANARCTVRKITSVVLEDESGNALSVPLANDFADGLPLYESPRNDGAPAGSPPAPYGNQPLPPRSLNSFTKACVSRVGDYNDNGIGDLSEGAPGRSLGSIVTRNSALEKYYSAYLRLSYFVELHDGWFADDGYHIRERSRADNTTQGVPIRYPAGTDPHWQTCERHRDADYAAPLSRAGGDFTDSTFGWQGMTHHSQFKCVEIFSEEAYDGAFYKRANNPELVYLPHGEPGVARAVGDGTQTVRNGCPKVEAQQVGVEIHDWTPNSCAVTGAHERAGVLAPNPVFPDISCTAVEYDNLRPGVRFMAVGYENQACERSDEVTVTAEDYSRGCINECAERTVVACPYYDEDGPSGSGRFTCDDEGRTFLGKMQCGCGRNYGGPTCELGCPGDGALMTADFSIETRSGYWMCGGVVASAGEMSGEGYTLRGYIPIAPVDGTVLESADGVYRLEAR